ncbi:heavy-metal-associated domain-containing protein [Flagellimonas meridianipacifica]|uniref:Copper chaperone CopZ n=1 Tax=Flagellimonas meridianipacifica TaxID=1080225 RepID=A0A2T0MFJ0_9FLAO|nr:heavy metal-associated domain-containing protein [Allomuricauda pacifica]PRX56335.1 copper chaperone CopZ [Allomuricauda pacifica]
MQQIYSVTGMTCQGCVASVQEKLSKIDGVLDVVVDLEKGEATMEVSEFFSSAQLQSALPAKYGIAEKGSVASILASSEEKSKWGQLRPLFLIFTYLFATAFLLNYKDWSTSEAMLDFMGLFYIVFSFFKFLDLKGFPESFRMYDPLAKAIPVYGWVYPFVELILGLMFLMRIRVSIALWVTVIILGITTIGVTRALLGKKTIRCACLGTALNLPMTEATFIENTIMLVMAFLMLLGMI